MVTPPNQRIFQEIPKAGDRDVILADAASIGAEVYIKFSAQKTLLTTAKKWIPPFKIELKYPEGPRPLVQNKVTIQFLCRNEKYFAQAYVQDTGNQFFLVIEDSIYKVQRRQSFRLKLPEQYPVVAEIFELNGHGVKESIRVIDLSEGGCSLLVPAYMAGIMGAYMGMKVKIGTRQPFTQFGHVRYLKAEKNHVRLGVQFEQGKQVNSDLFNLTRDLYVELFSKWSRRK